MFRVRVVIEIKYNWGEHTINSTRLGRMFSFRNTEADFSGQNIPALCHQIRVRPGRSYNVKSDAIGGCKSKIKNTDVSGREWFWLRLPALFLEIL